MKNEVAIHPVNTEIPCFDHIQLPDVTPKVSNILRCIHLRTPTVSDGSVVLLLLYTHIQQNTPTRQTWILYTLVCYSRRWHHRSSLLRSQCTVSRRPDSAAVHVWLLLIVTYPLHTINKWLLSISTVCVSVTASRLVLARIGATHYKKTIHSQKMKNRRVIAVC